MVEKQKPRRLQLDATCMHVYMHAAQTYQKALDQ